MSAEKSQLGEGIVTEECGAVWVEGSKQGGESGPSFIHQLKAFVIGSAY